MLIPMRLSKSKDRVTVIDPPPELKLLLEQASRGVAHVVKANKRDYSIVVPTDKTQVMREMTGRIKKLLKEQADEN